MGIIEIILLAVGLSMDAFAVSIFEGVSLRKDGLAIGFVTALAFGIFQGVMPLIGWFLGSGFSALLDQYAHWIAFALLAAIGIKMVIDGIRGEDHEKKSPAEGDDGSHHNNKLNGSKVIEIIMLAVATSIDALAAGVTFAFLDVNVWLACSIIAITTFALSMAGILIGRRFGVRFERPAEIIGGVVLIGIGVKAVIEHFLTS